MRNKRPILVTLLVGYVFLLAGLNATAVAVAIARADVFRGLETSIPLSLVAVFRGVWAAVWSVAGVSYLRRATWSAPLIVIAYPIYQLMLVLQWIFFVTGNYEQGRLAFVISYGVWSSALVIYAMTRRQAIQYLTAQDSNTHINPKSAIDNQIIE